MAQMFHLEDGRKKMLGGGGCLEDKSTNTSGLTPQGDQCEQINFSLHEVTSAHYFLIECGYHTTNNFAMNLVSIPDVITTPIIISL